MPEMRDRVRVPDLQAARARGDLAVEDQFFGNLQLRNGVYKLTYRHRFDQTLAATAAHARRIGARRVLDVACSSGVSTVEASERIYAALARTKTNDEFVTAFDLKKV